MCDESGGYARSESVKNKNDIIQREEARPLSSVYRVQMVHEKCKAAIIVMSVNAAAGRGMRSGADQSDIALIPLHFASANDGTTINLIIIFSTNHFR